MTRAESFKTLPDEGADDLRLVLSASDVPLLLSNLNRLSISSSGSSDLSTGNSRNDVDLALLTSPSEMHSNKVLAKKWRVNKS